MADALKKVCMQMEHHSEKICSWSGLNCQKFDWHVSFVMFRQFVTKMARIK